MTKEQIVFIAKGKGLISDYILSRGDSQYCKINMYFGAELECIGKGTIFIDELPNNEWNVNLVAIIDDSELLRMQLYTELALCAFSHNTNTVFVCLVYSSNWGSRIDKITIDSLEMTTFPKFLHQRELGIKF
jgi:hypothetical protein